MIKYICKKCNIQYDKSECIICKEKEFYASRKENRSVNEEAYRNQYISSTIYWCSVCKVPIYNKKCSVCGSDGKHLCSDLRPVFPEERLLLEATIGLKSEDNVNIWNVSGNRYVVNGEKLKIDGREVTLEDVISKDPKEIRVKLKALKDRKLDNLYKGFNEQINKFVLCNKQRLIDMENRAFQFTKEVAKNFTRTEMFISFSGGKDSTVMSSIVTRALGEPAIIHIYGDTTLEFRETEEYIRRFREKNRFAPFKIAINKDKNFESMCKLVGPPSRVMRWCCTIFKTGAITRKIDVLFKGKEKILSFHGIRWCESSNRKKYTKTSTDSKIAKQLVACPIIDWIDFDIWLYILGRDIDFNDAYRYGFTRVGCWLCPNNNDWSIFLSKIYVNNHENIKTTKRQETFGYKYDNWRSYLIDFAKKVGKQDAEVYVDKGFWKARQGGNGLAMSSNIHIDFKPCVNEENSFNYELKRTICKQLYEYFKPFGYVNYEYGNKRLNEVYILSKSNKPFLRLSGKEGSTKLKVTVLQLPIAKCKNYKEIKLKIDCQLTKFQMCLTCLACESVCKHNAIKVKSDAFGNDKTYSAYRENNFDKLVYKIDDKKCVRCGECINHFNAGCYMRKVLITKRGV
ncbi:TPA: phosphoadenosine phosphosulfate reductase family protein [Clostridium botulinum]|uniref:phosphoadenosine phosphosulfate reductase domain-containing protein n=1 Tax=Clostridium botulinum TaxID=1491 RepID=UPI00099D25D0|nr:phosphoadenosine phosphosulfate reductase family protein [Clostridium botulinum]NFA97007.1 phosphoadenosine phosphosulfate reductase [Clostridium botulinum]NFB52169.1 phosphoadenosine phosphosulfate reductase [Clostridium botulinum]NFC86455.1 phosphoadenosine phosphosulfate reductase [Clostridium botulinum]NFD03995.1 phosphoadenosine phosphosulfate reductase [Clostridium botulinum]NFD96487.1 phosphoadenosine phosphosulfate reductase [Clostridium botulinum]